MLTAGEARAKALQDLAILREIRDIEEAVLEAIANGEMQVTITDSSTVTNSDPTSTGYLTAVEYFDVWAGTTADRPKTLQMDKVIKYFSDLGYTIDRKTNTSTNNTFNWVLAW
jgi:hypothetical protein